MVGIPGNEEQDGVSLHSPGFLGLTSFLAKYVNEFFFPCHPHPVPIPSRGSPGHIASISVHSEQHEDGIKRDSYLSISSGFPKIAILNHTTIIWAALTLS